MNSQLVSECGYKGHDVSLLPSIHSNVTYSNSWRNTYCIVLYWKSVSG